MSALYQVIAKQELVRKLSSLLTPSRNSVADPILGRPPATVLQWNTFTRKHGQLVESILTKTIQSQSGWSALPQRRFQCDRGDVKKLIDRAAIHKHNQVAIFIECKRDLGKSDSGATRRINEYFEWVEREQRNIARELGMNPSEALIRFVVFNSYGVRSDGRRIPGIPHLLPDDLDAIFGPSVQNAFIELDRLTRSICEEFFIPDTVTPPPWSAKLGPGEVASESQRNTVETPEEFRNRLKKNIDRLVKTQR